MARAADDATKREGQVARMALSFLVGVSFPYTTLVSYRPLVYFGFATGRGARCGARRSLCPARTGRVANAKLRGERLAGSSLVPIL